MKMLLSALLLACAATAGHAATITVGFDGVTTETDAGPVYDYYEAGLHFQGNLTSWGRGGDVHLDDSGTPFYPSLDVTSPFRFAPISLDFVGGGQGGYLVVPDPYGDTVKIPYELQDVEAIGYRGGVQVAYQTFTSGLDGGPGTFRFSKAFSGIDSFRIGLTLDNAPGNFECRGGPCTHMTIDNFVLAPVPLPPGGALMIGALAMTIAFGWRQYPRLS